MRCFALALLLAVLGCFPVDPLPPVPIDPAPPVDPVPDNRDASGIKAGTWLVVIEETADRDPAKPQTRVIQDTSFWTGLRSHGVMFQISDKDDPRVSRYVAMLAGDETPALFVLNSDGKVLSRGPLPASTSQITALAVKVSQ